MHLFFFFAFFTYILEFLIICLKCVNSGFKHVGFLLVYIFYIFESFECVVFHCVYFLFHNMNPLPKLSRFTDLDLQFLHHTMQELQLFLIRIIFIPNFLDLQILPLRPLMKRLYTFINDFLTSGFNLETLEFQTWIELILSYDDLIYILEEVGFQLLHFT